eukprot:TRINITY_DN7186_c0_g1_i16.p1 TRINITY_DN7186_c0_g1~~TRINITY_DN7186_c0_g1_i16.p1  ORF type:complete len:474 (-),score=134.78 TRINITY_DN7186_c0_g1_i16:65-1486(-)
MLEKNIMKDVPKAANGSSELTDQVINTVKQDMETWESSGQWLFSCYSLSKECASVPGLMDISPEELRYEAYEYMKSGNKDIYRVKVLKLKQEYKERRNLLSNPDPNLQEVLQKIYNRQDTGDFVLGGKSSDSEVEGIWSTSCSQESRAGETELVEDSQDDLMEKDELNQNKRKLFDKDIESELPAKSNKLIDENVKQSASLKDKDNKLKTLESECAAQKAKVAKLMKENAKQSTSLKIKDDLINNLSQELVNANEEMLAEVSSLNNKWIITLKSATKLRAEFMIKDKANKALQAQLKNCKEKLDLKDGLIHDLENKVNSKDEEYTEQIKKVDEQKSKISDLEKDLQQKEQEIAKLKSQLSAVKGAEAKKAEIVDLKDALENRSVRIKELQDGINALDAIVKARKNCRSEVSNEDSNETIAERGQTTADKDKLIADLKMELKISNVEILELRADKRELQRTVMRLNGQVKSKGK